MLVEIHFEHNNSRYTARVLKNNPTAIVLPDKTVLKTCTVVHTSGLKKKPDELKRARYIFDGLGNLLPLVTLHRPGDWDRPIQIRFPIVYAEPE